MPYRNLLGLSFLTWNLLIATKKLRKRNLVETIVSTTALFYMMPVMINNQFAWFRYLNVMNSWRTPNGSHLATVRRWFFGGKVSSIKNPKRIVSPMSLVIGPVTNCYDKSNKTPCGRDCHFVLPDSQLYFRWIHLSHDAFLIPRLVFRNTAHDVFLRGETAKQKHPGYRLLLASRLLQESTPTNLAYLQKSQHNGTWKFNL